MCLSKSSAIPQFSKIIFAIPQILITDRSARSAVPQFSMYPKLATCHPYTNMLCCLTCLSIKHITWTAYYLMVHTKLRNVRNSRTCGTAGYKDLRNIIYHYTKLQNSRTFKFAEHDQIIIFIFSSILRNASIRDPKNILCFA